MVFLEANNKHSLKEEDYLEIHLQLLQQVEDFLEQSLQQLVYLEVHKQHQLLLEDYLEQSQHLKEVYLEVKHLSQQVEVFLEHHKDNHKDYLVNKAQRVHQVYLELLHSQLVPYLDKDKLNKFNQCQQHST